MLMRRCLHLQVIGFLFDLYWVVQSSLFWFLKFSVSLVTTSFLYLFLFLIVLPTFIRLTTGLYILLISFYKEPAFWFISFYYFSVLYFIPFALFPSLFFLLLCCSFLIFRMGAQFICFHYFILFLLLLLKDLRLHIFCDHWFNYPLLILCFMILF